MSIGFETENIGKSFFKISFSAGENSLKVIQYFSTASVAKTQIQPAFVIIASSFGIFLKSILLKSSVKEKNSSRVDTTLSQASFNLEIRFSSSCNMVPVWFAIACFHNFEIQAFIIIIFFPRFFVVSKNKSSLLILSKYIATTFVFSSFFNSSRISTSSKQVLFHKVTTFEKPRFFSKAQSVIATAIAPLWETILMFQVFISLFPKLKFKLL
jgi:hypothetical protein